MNRILVTGGAGFIGANLIRYLLERTDYSILSLDRLDEAGSLERLAELRSGYGDRLQCCWHDLRAPINPVHHPWLRGPLKWVVHMAAGSHVDRSTLDPIGFVMDNVVGTAQLLEFCRTQNRPEKCLVFSTDEVVGSAPDGVVFDELSPTNPLNVYSATKAGAEALCPAYANTFDMPLVVSRCTNAYGGSGAALQHPEKFIPLCTGKILRGELVQIHAKDGVPSSRYYVHVDDISSAVLTMLDKGGIIGGYGTGRYGISGDEELSNLDVAQQIAAILGKPLRYEFVDFVPTRPKHDQRYAISDARLRSLGWKPRVAFGDGLRETVLAVAGHLAKAT